MRVVLALAGVFLLGGCGDDSGPGPTPDGGSGPVDAPPGVDRPAPDPDTGPAPCESDDDCDDGLFCNGAETCASGTCAPGAPPDCDDSIDCTADTCSEDELGCLHTGDDTDGDGHRSVACGGMDCDDDDAGRFPGNAEICDPGAHDEDCDPETYGFRDADMDGFPDDGCCNDTGSELICGDDCNDGRPGIHPGVPEVCDGEDTDCDGATDEGVLITFYEDADDDMYGSSAAGAPTMEACFRPAGFADNDEDCDDAVGAVHPGAAETCELPSTDRDCNGVENDPPLGCTCTVPSSSMCTERGECAAGMRTCIAGAWSPCSILPVRPEVCDDRDEDCDGTLDNGMRIDCFVDPDDDGYAESGAGMVTLCPVTGRDAVGGCRPNHTNRRPMAPGIDCAEGDRDRHPGAAEVCNGFDDDCDGMSDEGLRVRCWADGDNDGYARPGSVEESPCADAARMMFGGCPLSYTNRDPASVADCDDGDPSVNVRVRCYLDADDDGYSPSGSLPMLLCPDPLRGVVGGCAPMLTNRAPSDGADCNDTAPPVHPGAAEVCNGADDDCDASIDDGLGTGTYYRDMDGDGYGTAAMPVSDCRRPPGYADVMGDCDDANASRNPGAPELCDTIDNDCDGMTDEMAMPGTWFRDADMDGFGSMASGTMIACTQPTGYSALSSDCDDTNSRRAPTLAETCDGYDNDCNGVLDAPGEDDDGDMHGDVIACGMTSPAARDCDDADPATYDGATEVCDRQDQNCSAGGGAEPAEDMDGDMYSPSGAACTGGYPRTDCNDGNGTIHPGVAEPCDGVDNECNGTVDGPPASALCSLPHANPVCTAATCRVMSCVAPWANCDGMHPNGCEIDTGSSLTHCGGCGNVCVGICRMGTCDPVRTLALGYQHTCFRRTGETLSCWGEDDNHQLGDATTGDRNVPIAVAVTEPLEVAAGCYHTCVTTAAGRAMCWGLNSRGQVGDGNIIPRDTPVEVQTAAGVPLTNVERVAAGGEDDTGVSCALQTGGTVVCWGDNAGGQLGTGTTGGMRSRPGPSVVGLTDAVEITSGGHRVCARRVGGTVVCWGQARLGDGTTLLSNVPVTVTGLTDAVQVSGGLVHTCARRAGGTVVCWGNNSEGQLGDGTATSRSAPVMVVGLTDAIDIAAGAYVTCAVRATGAVVCWGRNDAGALGDGTTTSRSMPNLAMPVVGISDALAVAVGGDSGSFPNVHVCALRLSGQVSCWGPGGAGQLGHGMFASSLTPVTVMTIP